MDLPIYTLYSKSRNQLRDVLSRTYSKTKSMSMSKLIIACLKIRMFKV